MLRHARPLLHLAWKKPLPKKMFTIVTDSYILCGVSQIYHADSMSPTETSTLSLAQLRRTFFFTVYNYRCCSYAFFCCLATRTSLDWRSNFRRGLLFSQEWKKNPVLWEATAFASSKHLHLVNFDNRMLTCSNHISNHRSRRLYHYHICTTWALIPDDNNL